jgi:hypothetical protein
MSDTQGPLSEIAKIYAHHAALPPPQKAFARTSYGSLILAACAYTAVTLGPDALNQYPSSWIAAFAAVSGLGLLLFIVGLRGPRMPADVMTYFWSLFWAVAFAAGSWWLAVYQPDWWDNAFVRGFCLSFACAQGLEFLLLLRPGAGNAEKIIQKQIDQTAINWRPARRT